MNFEQFERRKTSDDYGKYHNQNHAYLGELLEKLEEPQVEAPVLKIREYIRDESDISEVYEALADPLKIAADLRKEDLKKDHENDWSYPQEEV